MCIRDRAAQQRIVPHIVLRAVLKVFHVRQLEEHSPLPCLLYTSWRTEGHADETAYRLGFTLGQTNRYDIGWCGLGSGNALDELTDVVVCLPVGTAQQATL